MTKIESFNANKILDFFNSPVSVNALYLENTPDTEGYNASFPKGKYLQGVDIESSNPPRQL